MSDKVNELAYYLWEAAGKPEGQDQTFWLEANRRLTERKWYVHSGELKVIGHGKLEDVLELALRKADDEGLVLSPLVALSENGYNSRDPNELLVSTESKLVEYGLW